MIAETTVKATLTVEAHTLDDAEELLHELMAVLAEHPQILSDPDPSVRAHRVG